MNGKIIKYSIVFFGLIFSFSLSSWASEERGSYLGKRGIFDGPLTKKELEVSEEKEGNIFQLCNNLEGGEGLMNQFSPKAPFKLNIISTQDRTESPKWCLSNLSERTREESSSSHLCSSLEAMSGLMNQFSPKAPFKLNIISTQDRTESPKWYLRNLCEEIQKESVVIHSDQVKDSEIYPKSERVMSEETFDPLDLGPEIFISKGSKRYSFRNRNQNQIKINPEEKFFKKKKIECQDQKKIDIDPLNKEKLIGKQEKEIKLKSKNEEKSSSHNKLSCEEEIIKKIGYLYQKIEKIKGIKYDLSEAHLVFEKTLLLLMMPKINHSDILKINNLYRDFLNLVINLSVGKRNEKKYARMETFLFDYWSQKQTKKILSIKNKRFNEMKELGCDFIGSFILRIEDILILS